MGHKNLVVNEFLEQNKQAIRMVAILINGGGCKVSFHSIIKSHRYPTFSL